MDKINVVAGPHYKQGVLLLKRALELARGIPMKSTRHGKKLSCLQKRKEADSNPVRLLTALAVQFGRFDEPLAKSILEECISLTLDIRDETIQSFLILDVVRELVHYDINRTQWLAEQIKRVPQYQEARFAITAALGETDLKAAQSWVDNQTSISGEHIKSLTLLACRFATKDPDYSKSLLERAIEETERPNLGSEPGIYLQAIISVLAQYDHYTALKISQRIHHPRYKAEALCDIVAFSSRKASDWAAPLLAYALDLATGIEPAYDKAWTHLRIGSLLTAVDEEWANEILTRADQFVYAIERPQHAAWTRRGVALALSPIAPRSAFKLFLEAWNTAQEITNKDDYMAITTQIIYESALVNVDHGREEASQIANPWYRAMALSHIAFEIAETFLDEALKLAEGIVDPFWQGYAFCKIVEALWTDPPSSRTGGRPYNPTM